MSDIQIRQFTNTNGDTIIVLPLFTQEDVGKVLAVNSEGTGLEWISISDVPANAASVNGEPVGVNGDYITVGEGQ